MKGDKKNWKTKRELINEVAKEQGLTQEEAVRYTDALLDKISSVLKEGNFITFRGFGTFFPQVRKARTGVNPRSKEYIDIPERKWVKFKPSKKLLAFFNK